MLPVKANYMNNILAFNPAYAGAQDALSATISYRNQWTGFKGAPQNSLISLHTPIKNDKIGLGFFFERNSFGINRETRFCGNYSYRIEFHEGIFALGLGFGATVNNVAWNELVAVDNDDVLLNENPVTVVLPYFNPGAYYYSSLYFVGISVPMLFNNELERHWGKNASLYSATNVFITGGYNFKIDQEIRVLPSMLIKIAPDHPIQVDINANVILREKIWLGVGYRSKSIFVPSFQLQLNPQLRLAYSYDYDMGRIGKYTSGSHEFVLNYVFSYYRRVVGPRQF
jgi:type IX secretion system PorP/SprF family membrane protein